MNPPQTKLFLVINLGLHKVVHHKNIHSLDSITENNNLRYKQFIAF